MYAAIVRSVYVHAPSRVQINLLNVLCQKGEKDKYSGTVDAIIGAAKQIREEVATMEVDILVSETMAQVLKKTKPQMDSAVKEVQLSALMASSELCVSVCLHVCLCVWMCVMCAGSVAPDSAGMKLMASVGHLKDVSSKTVCDTAIS